jgi:hypothetical protein
MEEPACFDEAHEDSGLVSYTEVAPFKSHFSYTRSSSVYSLPLFLGDHSQPFVGSKSRPGGRNQVRRERCVA